MARTFEKVGRAINRPGVHAIISELADACERLGVDPHEICKATASNHSCSASVSPGPSVNKSTASGVLFSGQPKKERMESRVELLPTIQNADPILKSLEGK